MDADGPRIRSLDVFLADMLTDLRWAQCTLRVRHHVRQHIVDSDHRAQAAAPTTEHPAAPTTGSAG